MTVWEPNPFPLSFRDNTVSNLADRGISSRLVQRRTKDRLRKDRRMLIHTHTHTDKLAWTCAGGGGICLRILSALLVREMESMYQIELSGRR